MYSQDNRSIRVDTTLGKDELLLLEVSGRESISSPFSYRLRMMSENSAILGKDLLRKPMTVTLETQDGERKLHGIVNRFARVGRDMNLTFYEAELVPWLWFLSLGRNLRIFQNVNALTIVQHIFTEAGYSDFTVKCQRTYPPREYCVQYRESNLEFVSRLMEEEGIYFFFEHDEQKHNLVLADDNSAMPATPFTVVFNSEGRAFANEDYVQELRREDCVRVSAVTLTDYDYLQPSLNLLKTMKAGPEEEYDWPGKYSEPEDGDRYARLRLEAEESLLHVTSGAGFCRSLEAGHTVDVEMPDGERVSYALLDVSFELKSGDYRSWDSGAYEGYCNFTGIPKETPYRPQRRTPRPVVHGSQTAIVVGAPGEEIWVDKHGRVKVQFHWDREGRMDEDSSCWVRFSTGWAGKGWGMISIPRIGQEVIIDFLDGDPDRPIITGRVYNAEQVPPYTLPDKDTVSGIKSRSTKGGTTEMFNEIRMDDTKDAEELYIHAQKDEKILVEHDRSLRVENDEMITVVNDRRKDVEGNEFTTIGKNREESVSKNEKISIGADRTEEVGGNEEVSISGNAKIKIEGDSTYQVDGKETVKVGGDRSQKIGGNEKLDVDGKITISAGQSITLKVGGNSIKIDAAGITIKGTMIKIKGNSMVQAQAPITKITADSLLKLKGTVNQVNGDATLMLKGGVTMIN